MPRNLVSAVLACRHRSPSRAGCLVATACLAILAGATAFAPAAVADAYTWSTNASGYWDETANWSPVGTPYGRATSAEINRDPLQQVVVTLRGGALINALFVAPGNTLLLNTDRSVMCLSRDTTSSEPRLVNHGSVVLSDWARLVTDGDLSTSTGYELFIQGSGSISLGSGCSMGASNYGRITLDIDPVLLEYNTITGHGSQTEPAAMGGFNASIPLVNRGEILADGGYMRLSHVRNEPTPWNGLYYGGIVGVREYGWLTLENTVTGGYILPRQGEVRLNSVTLKDVTLGPGTTRVTYLSWLHDTSLLMEGAELQVGSGTWLDLDNALITNHGVIRVKSNGHLVNVYSQCPLQGTGRVVLEPPGGRLEADGAATNWLIQGEGHTIEGGGYVTAWVANYGTFRANDGTLTMYGALFGTGAVSIEGQDSTHLATLVYDANSTLKAGSFYINEFGRLQLVATTQVDVQGNFGFALRNEAAWPFATKTLNMCGSGAWQSLEIGGEDLGLVPAGFTNNFQIGTLRIKSGANVCLTDAVDNGNRHSPEALYVQNLVIEAGATLNLDGQRLYTYLAPSGTPELVLIDETNFGTYSHLFPGVLTSWPLADAQAPPAARVSLLNRPNPFGGSTTLEFALPAEGRVTLDVHDVVGRRVTRLADGPMAAGTHAVPWHGELAGGGRAQAGVYLAVLSTPRGRTVRRMLLVR